MTKRVEGERPAVVLTVTAISDSIAKGPHTGSQAGSVAGAGVASAAAGRRWPGPLALLAGPGAAPVGPVDSAAQRSAAHRALTPRRTRPLRAGVAYGPVTAATVCGAAAVRARARCVVAVRSGSLYE